MATVDARAQTGPQTHFALELLPRSGFEKIAPIIGGPIAEQAEARRFTDVLPLRGMGSQHIREVSHREADGSGVMGLYFSGTHHPRMAFRDGYEDVTVGLEHSVHYFDGKGAAVTFINARRVGDNENAFYVASLRLEAAYPGEYDINKAKREIDPDDHGSFAEAVRLAAQLKTSSVNKEALLRRLS